MKLKLIVAAAALISLFSCSDVDYLVGSNLVSDNLRYTMVTGQTTPLDVNLLKVDSLSGYSQSYVTIGSIRDEELGLTSRSCALRLFPINRTLVFGDDPVVKRLHLSLCLDTVSVNSDTQRRILQNVNVYAVDDELDPRFTYDCNGDISSKVDWSRRISIGTPVINGRDSLSFDFSTDYARQFLSLTQEDLKDIVSYRRKIQGFYLNTDEPVGNAGRINLFKVQLGYDASYNSLTGNYAKLVVNGNFNGVRKDTMYFFYLSPNAMYDVDSLLVNTSSGSLPQYALNLTSQDASKTTVLQGQTDYLCIEGGGGLKPHISAKSLKRDVLNIIRGNGHDPSKVTFSKASLVFDYDAPDARYEGLDYFPQMLSPTIRMYSVDTTGGANTRLIHYDGISDASSESENQGDIDLSLQQYSPDITYHLQEIISTDDETLDKGYYDIWLLIMYYKTVTTVNQSASDLSDYYSMLAYQQYYSSMYGGYGGYGYGGYGYGGYGYGGYGYDPYTNYYSYMMAAQYASQSSTSTSTNLELDKERFYKAKLCGPTYPDPDRRPRLVFSYAAPKDN